MTRPDSQELRASSAAQEIVHEAVEGSRRLADERGLDASTILRIAAQRLQEFAFGLGATSLSPEDFMKREARVVRVSKGEGEGTET